MSRREKMALFAIALMALVGAVAVGSWPAARPASEDAKRIDLAEREINELRNEIKAQRALTQLVNAAHAASVQAAAAQAAQAASTAPAATQAVPESAPAPAKEVSTEDVRDSLSARFVQENYDSNWSVVARGKIQTLLAAAIPTGARVLSVDCKTSLCRAEVSEPDIESHKQLIRKGITSATPWAGSTMVTLADDPASGHITSVAFFAREGKTLAPDDLAENP
ncbi:MAG: hypothetical protein WDO69_09865 [Pseudomonadota bacterium]